MVQNIFKSHFGLGISLKSQFWTQNWDFHFFEKSNFQFSSITHFLSHKFQDPSCRICSYGPHGPFWFSVKKCPDTVKRYQKNENWEKSVFEITVKMNLFCGGKFWKATFVCRMLPQGLLFLINRHFWKFQTCPFWKKCAFPYIWAFSRWAKIDFSKSFMLYHTQSPRQLHVCLTKAII